MKKILIIFILLLVSGCSCKYELSINNSQVNEILTINGVTTEIPEQADLENFTNHTYKKTLQNDILKYEATYNLGNYKTSDFFTCFDSYNILESEDSYTIRTGKKFRCMPYQYNDFDIIKYDKLEIVISTNHSVYNHNADRVENNIYYWYITEDNINDSEIYFHFSKEVKQPILMLTLAIFMGIVFVIGIIVYLIAKSKGKKSNKI